MWELEGSRKEMWGQIDANHGAREVRIKTKPSRRIFFMLLEKTQVRKIYITGGLLKTVSKKVIDALKSSGIEITLLEGHAGRPAVFSDEIKEKAIEMMYGGKRVKKISEELGVPATAIYAWKRNEKKPQNMQVPDST
jgi:hypothetical protein